MLAHARDPGNAGTVVRAADAAGAGGVLLTGDSVDPYNGKCVRASAGSAVPPAGERRATGWRTTCRPCGPPACGCSPPTATPTSTWTRPPTPACSTAPTAWVFGNEAWGLPEQTRALADAVVKVPIHGRAESLNLATAAAVCLYASARAHRTRPTG